VKRKKEIKKKKHREEKEKKEEKRLEFSMHAVLQHA